MRRRDFHEQSELSDNTVYAIVTRRERGRKSKGYILGNECLTMQQMFRLLSTLTDTKGLKMISLVGTDKIDGKLSDLGEKVTEKPARMTNSAIYNLISNNIFDCSKAKGEMGFHTHPFAESIVDTIEWPK